MGVSTLAFAAVSCLSSHQTVPPVCSDPSRCVEPRLTWVDAGRGVVTVLPRGGQYTHGVQATGGGPVWSLGRLDPVSKRKWSCSDCGSAPVADGPLP